jgi:DNA-binding HxlR family transcriptional regulator
MRKVRSKTIGECPCEYALRYIGGAWKILLLVLLDRAKIQRHTELKRVLRGITTKMLTQQLREMERDGLITRTVYAEVPPRVGYQLTPFGETLRPVIDAMWTWGNQTRQADAGSKFIEVNSKAKAASSARRKAPTHSDTADCP